MSLHDILFDDLVRGDNEQHPVHECRRESTTT